MHMRMKQNTDVHYSMLAIWCFALNIAFTLLQDVGTDTNFDIHISFFPGSGDVWFSLRNTTYQNNSIVILEDIGEGGDALLCMTTQTACCRPPYTDGMGPKALGNWFFPNGTRVPSSGLQWDIHRTRGQMMVLLQRRRGGAEGIYNCQIPDTSGFSQTKYIGVYSASTGEWHMYSTLA